MKSLLESALKYATPPERNTSAPTAVVPAKAEPQRHDKRDPASGQYCK